jgi:predicted site-specific integrase-resolvase
LWRHLPRINLSFFAVCIKAKFQSYGVFNLKQKVKKRATSAIPIIVNEKEDIEPLVEDLIEIIEAANWNSKSEFRDLFRMRAEAFSIIVLTF